MNCLSWCTIVCNFFTLVVIVSSRAELNNDSKVHHNNSESPHHNHSSIHKHAINATATKSTYGRREHSSFPCQPRHIHLSVGKNHDSTTESSMIISFSFLPDCARYAGSSAVGAVRVGSNPGELSQFVIGDADDAQSYNASLTPHQLAHAIKRNHSTVYLSDVYYHIEVHGLKPGTRYIYECLLVHDNRLPRQNFLRQGQSNDSANYQIISQSTQSTFLTPPAAGEWYPPPLDKSIKFAVLGDLSARPHARETIKNLEQNLQFDGRESPEQQFHRHHSQGLDCILLAGDLAYAHGDHVNWDDWFDMWGQYDFSRSIPMQIALGNHDLDHKNTTEIALAYEKRFRMPQVQPAIRELAPNDLFTEQTEYFQAKDFMPYEWGNAYYSFTFGASHVVVLSSYSSFLPGSTQHQWLRSELQSVDRSKIPWLIVMLHCPIYTTFNFHNEEMFMREARVYLEPLFVQYTVSFVIAGHQHSYMRTVPTVNDKPHPKGPVYIIQGNGGRQANEAYISPIAEDFVEIRDHSMYGYGTLELLNVTHARWKWVKTGYNAEDEVGQKGRYEPDFALNDYVWITNQLLAEHDDDGGSSPESFHLEQQG